MESGAASVENSLQFSKKLNTKLSYDPAILPLGINPKELRIGIQANTSTGMLRAARVTKIER